MYSVQTSISLRQLVSVSLHLCIFCVHGMTGHWHGLTRCLTEIDLTEDLYPMHFGYLFTLLDPFVLLFVRAELGYCLACVIVCIGGEFCSHAL